MRGGYNALLRSQNFGGFRLRVETLEYGTVITSAQGYSSTRRALYPYTTIPRPIQAGLVFSGYEERDRFSEWMRNYMEKVVAGRGFRAVMRLQVPSRKFVRDVIPQGPLEYGEGVRDLTYHLRLTFVSVSDPTDLTRGAKAAGASYFSSSGKGVGKYLYPANKQLSGPASLEGTIFDEEGPKDGDPAIDINPIIPGIDLDLDWW